MSNKYSGKTVILGFTGSPLSCLTVRLLQEQGMKIKAYAFFCDEWINMVKINHFDKALVTEKAEKLGLDLTIEDISGLFFPKVVDHIISDRINGKFSSPYWLCRLMIFEHLYDKFLRESADYVAVSSLVRSDGDGFIRKAKETSLDQSALTFLLKDKLKSFLFPVGPLLKKDLIHLALDLKIEGMEDALNSTKKVCVFNPKMFSEFLKLYIPSFLRGRGQVISFQEYVIGFHEGGVYSANIGERFDYSATRGKVAVPDLDSAEVVLDLRPEENVVIMGPAKMLLRKRAIARNVTWLVEPRLFNVRPIQVVFDNGTNEMAHLFYALGNGVLMDFNKITNYASRGRYVAFYDGDTLIGGGRVSVPIREERYI